MADVVSAIAKTSAAAATLASPKLPRNKGAVPFPSGTTNIAFGCEHLQLFHEQGDKAWKTFLQEYVKTLKAIENQHPIVPQTFKDSEPRKNSVKGPQPVNTTIRPTLMCVQCPFINSERTGADHWEKKEHCFFVDSRSGSLHCNMCGDYVFDQTCETLRSANMTGSNKKRKFEEFASPEDYRSVALNSVQNPCRAIGLRGLYNMGNTCFMSVVLQSLIHNPFIRAFYLTEGHPHRDEHTNVERKLFCVSCSLDEIFTEFYSKEETHGYGAAQMLRASWLAAENAALPQLAGYKQQDAHEYMQFLLNALHTANDGLFTGECDCVIHKAFHGKMQSTLTCTQCDHQTIAFDPFLDLSLDLPTPAKKRKANGDNKGDERPVVPAVCLEDCLERFTSEEKIPAAVPHTESAKRKDGYTCSGKCKAPRDARKHLSMNRLPPVLNIHLKRFSHPGEISKKASKIDTAVQYPMILNMAPYMTAYTAPETILSPSQATNGITEKNVSKETNGMNGNTKDSGSKADAIESIETSSKIGSSTSKSSTISADTKNDTTATVRSTSPDRWPAMNYHLSSVIVHKGQMDTGHYVNYTREGNEWFLFDDSKVTMVNESEVLKAEAYILVYVTSDVVSGTDE